MKILMTGATGFTGERLAKQILVSTDWDIISLERITVRKNLFLSSPRIHHVYHDFRAEFPARLLDEIGPVDYIAHIGAEVHGLRSLENPELFIHTNVMGTFNLLEAARVLQPKMFLYLSSAETVGSVEDGGSLDEGATLRPSNPYAAAKAAGEMLVRSYHQSFKVPAITVRTMNIFGERQGLGKFIPDTIKKMVDGTPVICHVNAEGVSGSRQWIYVGTLVHALRNLLITGKAGETYHVAGIQLTNWQVIGLISAMLGVSGSPQHAIPGRSHDMRYSIADTKLDARTYDTTDTTRLIMETVSWYQQNKEWLR